MKGLIKYTIIFPAGKERRRGIAKVIKQVLFKQLFETKHPSRFFYTQAS